MIYQVHIAGPDDIEEYKDELVALRVANDINKLYLQDREKNPDSEVLFVATVRRLKTDVRDMNMSDESETCAFCSQDLTAEDQAFELHDRLRDTCDEFRETLNCRHARIDDLEKELKEARAALGQKDSEIERLRNVVKEKNEALQKAWAEIRSINEVTGFAGDSGND